MRFSTVGAIPGGNELSRRHREDALRPHDVVEATLARLAGADPSVFISRVSATRLRARADELAAGAGPGPGMPLYGVPFAVKDNIDVAGIPTTAACPAFAYTPDRDANCVRRLLAAGAILVGKTNLDQFATGLTGVRSPYGACESVYGGDLVSGGSSSGSAVAVAAGLVPFALGTDTAGSGRVPAAMNGIVGLKPTLGLVGASGVLPACRSLDCVSVFTANLDDAATVLDILAGPDPEDPWSRTPGSREWHIRSTGSRECAIRAGWRVALAADGELDFDGDTELAATFAAASTRAARLATDVHPIPLAPLLEAGDLLYGGPWVAERLAGLAEFLAAHPDDVLPVTRAVIERGREFDAVDAFRAIHRLRELQAWCDRMWQDAGCLLLPTVPTTFTRAQIAEQPVARNLVLGRYTQFANLLDLAVVALPAAHTEDGRPVGISLLGPAFSDDRLLRIANQLQEVT